MKNTAPPATRLTELLASWPGVSWQEVREADPRAFTQVTTGAMLIVPAVFCTVLTVLVTRGPRHTFRFLKQKLSRPLPHLMVDGKRNGSLRKMLPGSTTLSFEGDFDRYFTVYVPAGYERDALELFTPDVMVCLIDYGKNWDIEIIEDQLIIASSRVRPGTDRDEVAAMLHFAELLGGEIGHQASTYSDPRAERPRSQIAVGGRRLRRRSEAWIWATVLGLVAVCFAFPFVLGWFIDR